MSEQVLKASDATKTITLRNNEATGELQMFVPFLPPEYIGPVGAGIGAAVILLRFLTTVPLLEK